MEQTSTERGDMTRSRALALAITLLLVVAACGRADRRTDPAPSTSAPTTTVAPQTGELNGCVRTGVSTCTIPGYDDRPYEVHLSALYDGTPMPVVVNFHGGGGSIDSARTTSCPGGDSSSPGCLHALGVNQGFVVVLPSGSGGPLLPNIRTWNAGGDGDAWNCVSGRACQTEVDDIAYVTAVLEHLGEQLSIDEQRIYATGLSNGAAMSHRVACEMSDRFAAIASVAGGNQLSTTGDCAAERPMPILHIHGSEDRCWTYAQSADACLDAGGEKIGVVESLMFWANHNGCDVAPTSEQMPDLVDDGLTTDRLIWSGCDEGVVVEHLRIDGGGHVWPNGHAFSRRSGTPTEDFGAEVVLEFFERFELP